jgi:endonuclease YncB( thermonuclease family)
MGNCFSETNITPILASATLENTPELTLVGHKCEAKVVDVHDGDTITLAFILNSTIYHKSCRVAGVDCAEIRTKNKEEKKLGLEATDFAKGIVLNKIIWAEFTDKEDKYGRLLATIYPQQGGESLDKILIRKGYGYEYHGEKKKKFDEWRI